MIKRGLFVVSICTLYLLTNCGDANTIEDIDPDVQLEADSIIISDYFQQIGISDFETSDIGVRYVILDEGTGDAIDESDIVTFNYIGTLANDTIFDTSIAAVGDSIRAHYLEDSVGLEDKTIHESFLFSFTETREYNPFEITYSSLRWSFGDQFVLGFSDGVAQTFGQMNIGGSALIAMPSQLGFGATAQGLRIPANSVLIFELRPTGLKKQ